MSDLMPKGRLMKIDGTERNFLFSFRAIEEIQEKKKDTLDKIMADYMELILSSDVAAIMKETSFLLDAILIREGDETIEEGHFLNWFAIGNIYQIAAQVLAEYGINMPESDEDDPNAESGAME